MDEQTSKSHKIIFIVSYVILILILLVMAGVFVVYGQGKTSVGKKFQDQIWNNIISSINIHGSTDRTSSFSYADTGEFHFLPSEIIKDYGIMPGASDADLKSYDDKYGFVLSGMSVATKGGGYFNLIDQKNPKLDVSFAGTYINSGINYNGSVDLKSQDKNNFVRYNYSKTLEDSQLAQQISGFVPEDKFNQYKNIWLKVADLPDTTAYTAQLQSITGSTDSAGQKLKDIIQNNRPFNIKSFDRITSVNGHLTWHYELELDKSKLRSIAQQGLVAEMPSMSQADQKYAMQFIDVALSKYQVQDFEVWVGLTDHKVYKTVFQSNNLSLTQTLDAVYNSFTTGDGKKLLDPKNQDPNQTADQKSQQTKDFALKLFKSLPFSAQISINTDITSYSENKNVKFPKDYKDSSVLQSP